MSCYVHDLPGRLRVRVPAIKGDPATAGKLVAALSNLEGITSVTSNPLTGSLLIRYDANVINASACLVKLNIRRPVVAVLPSSTQPRAEGLAFKVAQAAAWYALEKTVERFVLAALL